MVRLLRVAAVQVGRIDRSTPRDEILARLIALLVKAAEAGVRLAVFPETTVAAFLPRYWIEDDAEVASFFEEEPEAGIAQSASLKAFFDKANELRVDVSIGYGEKTPAGERFNTAAYVSRGSTLFKYRKVHLAGTTEPFSKEAGSTNQLEKRYYTPGNLGFPAFRAPSLRASCGGTSSPIVGQMICNDRRWAEGWRVLGLQGVEIVCIGFLTAAWAPQLWGIDPKSMTREEAYADVMFHHKLVCQAHAYTNSTFCIAAARCGIDDGIHPLISGSLIVDPEGHILAENQTEDDEVIVAEIDLDACQQGKSKTFAFAKHRRPEHYSVLVERAGVVEPEEPVA